MKKIANSTYNVLIFFLIRGSFLGICASNIYTISKQNGWLSYLIATILGIIPLLIYYYIIKKYPNKNILEITTTIFGKKIGNIFNIIILVFVYIYAISIFYNLITFISSQYLYRTPNLAISIMFGLCFFYLINKGITTISRTSLMLFYITIFLYILTVLGLVGESNISNFLPFNEYSFTSILKGSYISLSLNIAPLFLLTIIPYNKIEKHEKFVKNTIIFYLLALISIYIMNFFVISIYGAKFANIMQYPEFHLLKRLTLIGFAERIENILSIQLVFDLLITIVMCLYFIKTYFKNLINKTGIKEYILDILLVSTTILTVLKIFNTSTEANTFYLKYLSHFNFIGFIIIPIIILKKIKVESK